MKRWPFIFLWLLVAPWLHAQPAQVILLRHAEKPDDELNDHLSARGAERARALVGYFTNSPALTTNGPLVALFAPRQTRGRTSLRPHETLAPLAKELKLPVVSPYPAKDYAELARRILRSPEYRGKTVVICWVHDYLPDLAKTLGVKSKKASWKNEDFDRVWSITFQNGKAVLANLPQNLLPGDSKR